MSRPPAARRLLVFGSQRSTCVADKVGGFRAAILPLRMLRVILGLVKGAIIGGAVGYGATQLGVTTGTLAFATYAAVGFLVGLVCGKAIWRQETLWTPILKGLFGAGICVLLYWAASKFLGGLTMGFTAQLGAADRPLVQIPLVLAPVLAIVYGIFVEIDDGERKGAAPADSKLKL